MFWWLWLGSRKSSLSRHPGNSETTNCILPCQNKLPVVSPLLQSPVNVEAENLGLNVGFVLKTLLLAVSLALNFPITTTQLQLHLHTLKIPVIIAANTNTTAANTNTTATMPPTTSVAVSDHSLHMHTRTSSVVAVLLGNYVSALAAHDITLSEEQHDLVEGFLTTLVACDSLPETVLPISELLCTSIPQSLHLGTGLTVTQNIAAAISSAKYSVLLSTCFWAESTSRDAIADALRDLSQRAAEENTKVAVRIGFSSGSVSQKLFHTSSPKGKTYLPSTWATLGLPGPEELLGLDMVVKSIFFLPFSVLHSKFCIIDGRILFLPSSNISWEVWLEQCTTFTGSIVNAFSSFWEKIWGGDETTSFAQPLPLPADTDTNYYPTLFLPQPHHRNPAFSPSVPFKSVCFPAAPPPPPPMTPQNTFLIHSLTRAKRSIFIQTPNLTCMALIRALEAALARGVNVEIVTCRRMMVAEQFLTTGGSSSTESSVKALIRADTRLRAGKNYVARERRKIKGVLGIWYYTGSGPSKHAPEPRGSISESGLDVELVEAVAEATQNHVKALIIDGDVTVLGSANGDRASWYTSQEVNVAVLGEGFAKETRRTLVQALGGRLERVAGVAALREDQGPDVMMA